MILRDACYFCTSPYQLFPIYAIVLSKKEKADLYIDPQFNNANQFIDRIKATRVFCNVISVDSRSIYNGFFIKRKGLLSYIKLLYFYLNVNLIAHKILLNGVNYKRMFISSKAIIPRIVQLYFIKNKIKTKTAYFEDGLGSYSGQEIIILKPADWCVRRLLFGKSAVKFNYKIYLFSPELFFLLNSHSTYGIERIPNILKRNDYKSLLNKVFSINAEDLIKENVIILDVLKTQMFSLKNAEKLINIYNLIINKMGKVDTIIKKHPRSIDNEIPSVKYYTKFGVPFESICMNSNMNNKVLISYGSTAVGTPKVLFDQEPIVILLHCLVSTKTKYDDSLKSYFLKIRELYKDKSRFIIPNNIIELIEALDKITIRK